MMLLVNCVNRMCTNISVNILKLCKWSVHKIFFQNCSLCNWWDFAIPTQSSILFQSWVSDIKGLRRMRSSEGTSLLAFEALPPKGEILPATQATRTSNLCSCSCLVFNS